MAHAWRQKCSWYRRRSCTMCTTSVIGRRETPSVHTDAIIALARAGQQSAPPTGGGRRSKRGEMRKTGSRHKLFSGLTERLESAAVNGLVITNAGVIITVTNSIKGKPIRAESAPQLVTKLLRFNKEAAAGR